MFMTLKLLQFTSLGIISSTPKIQSKCYIQGKVVGARFPTLGHINQTACRASYSLSRKSPWGTISRRGQFALSAHFPCRGTTPGVTCDDHPFPRSAAGVHDARGLPALADAGREAAGRTRARPVQEDRRLRLGGRGRQVNKSMINNH